MAFNNQPYLGCLHVSKVDEEVLKIYNYKHTHTHTIVQQEFLKNIQVWTKFAELKHMKVSYSDDRLSLERKTTEQITMNIKDRIDDVCLTDLNLQEGDLNTQKIHVYACCHLMNSIKIHDRLKALLA